MGREIKDLDNNLAYYEGQNEKHKQVQDQLYMKLETENKRAREL